MRTSTSKKGQIAITFNWIYVLIAGVVILLFFLTIIYNQKEAAERELSIDVVNLLESIFTGAQVSEKTRTPIDTSGLVDFTLFFECSDGVNRYGIQDTEGNAENGINSIFAPLTLQTPRLILWSLPFSMPYKTTDFLMVSSPNIAYYFVGQDDLAEQFIEASQDKDAENVIIPQNSLNAQIILPADYAGLTKGGNYHVRIIDLAGGLVDESGGQQPVPPELAKEDDSSVSLVRLAGNRATYFKKQGSQWIPDGAPVPIPTLGEKRDAATYAAFIAGNAEMYACGLRNGYRRLQHVTKMYHHGKLAGLQTKYNVPGDVSACPPLVNALEDTMIRYESDIGSCILPTGCQGNNLITRARALEVHNNQLQSNGCFTLY
ncbi:TPA: hypothetical protein HA278_06465 [Candidatus Woesearchaeota archaeon]|nr:hypothetical protein [Candidatus Woesearchaeota archaeon]